MLFCEYSFVTHSIVTRCLGLTSVAGWSTTGSSYKQCSSEKYRDIHGADEGETLDDVDRVAALKEDKLIWAILLVYLWCRIDSGWLCKMFVRGLAVCCTVIVSPESN
jgi:hypothetical protein